MKNGQCCELLLPKRKKKRKKMSEKLLWLKIFIKILLKSKTMQGESKVLRETLRVVEHTATSNFYIGKEDRNPFI